MNIESGRAFCAGAALGVEMVRTLESSFRYHSESDSLSESESEDSSSEVIGEGWVDAQGLSVVSEYIPDLRGLNFGVGSRRMSSSSKFVSKVEISSELNSRDDGFEAGGRGNVRDSLSEMLTRNESADGVGANFADWGGTSMSLSSQLDSCSSSPRPTKSRAI